jgi:hypothetical protein
MSGDFTEAARDLSQALQRMHKALVRTEMPAVRDGTQASPGAFAQMQRLMHDPALGWLKPVSSLIVELDQMLSEGETLDEAQAAEIRRGVESLFGPTDPSRQHGIQVAVANRTSEHPEVAMALGDLRRALGALPAALVGEEPTE